MAAVYRTLYEKYEQNDVLHVGIQEVVEAEKEIDTFLKSLDRNQRDQLDTLLGRLSRAYEMQGFLFGGLASVRSGTERRLPNRATDTAGASGLIMAQHLLRSARLTARQIRSSMSIRVSLLPLVLPVWMTAQSERCARESCPMRAVFSFGTSSSKSFTGTQKYFKFLPFCSCFPRARVVQYSQLRGLLLNE